ncbi:hypothetical protein KIPB_003133 [Kipferlia bialata]|uniref:Fungal lipase-type domain-containing protein n=1 Tax=Kipferlia bialata TaxID=797122 RepID=A0A9K3CRS1_9EUKA|nr:hypothetical protein KIPB_003133 [Kipferlia bialata]|eukprot:g3133.t1
MKFRDLFTEKFWSFIPYQFDELAMKAGPDLPLPTLSGITGFCLPDAVCLARLSAAIYENDTDALYDALSGVGLRSIQLLQHKELLCILAVSGESNVVCVCRGTQPTSVRNWVTDITYSLIDGGEIGTVHKGYSKALDKVYETIKNYVVRELGDGTLYMTGHSMGGALSTLALARLTCTQPITEGHASPSKPLVDAEKCALYTFGSPRLTALCPTCYRVIHKNDPFCRTPLESQGYCHVPSDGRVLYLDSHGMHTSVPGGLFTDTMLRRWTWTLDDWVLFTASFPATGDEERSYLMDPVSEDEEYTDPRHSEMVEE